MRRTISALVLAIASLATFACVSVPVAEEGTEGEALRADAQMVKLTDKQARAFVELIRRDLLIVDPDSRASKTDLAQCKKVGGEVFRPRFVAGSGLGGIGALGAVSCTATCSGERCSPSGCTPNDNGGCTSDVSCSTADGCTGASCSATTSGNSSLIGLIDQNLDRLGPGF